MVEKPPRGEAPLTFCGADTFCQKKSGLLEFTPREPVVIPLTDAIDALMKLEQVDAYYMKGKSHDCGSKLGT